MKINSTPMIFGMILSITLGTGILSAIVAYKFGTLSLEAVESPAENPTQKLAIKNVATKKSEKSFQLMKEKDILVNVYDYVHNQKEANKKQKSDAK